MLFQMNIVIDSFGSDIHSYVYAIYAHRHACILTSQTKVIFQETRYASGTTPTGTLAQNHAYRT